MKKTNLIKGLSILLISVMVILFSSNVFAADNSGFNDLTSTLSSGNSNSNSNSNSNNANVNNSNRNVNNANTNANKNSNSNNSNTNSSSIYNNTNLPKTGVESSIPVAMLVVIFGVSAVYAYKKISEYKNI